MGETLIRWCPLCMPNADSLGLGLHLLGFSFAVRFSQQPTVILERRGHAQVIGSQGVLSNGQRALVQRFGLGVLAL